MPKIEGRRISKYTTFLQENSRPPSRGGNTKALHSHQMIIDGEKYSFLAFGSKHWVYKRDTVSFEYETKDIYKNIIKESLLTVDENGKKVVRGLRNFDKPLRTAETRMPVSRREFNS